MFEKLLSISFNIEKADFIIAEIIDSLVVVQLHRELLETRPGAILFLIDSRDYMEERQMINESTENDTN